MNAPGTIQNEAMQTLSHLTAAAHVGSSISQSPSKPMASEKTRVEEMSELVSVEERKRKTLEHTLEELQNERERLREKNRTNSQRFRDRKKGYMDGLFEEKYRLGKENNELKAEHEKLRKLLQEALAENELHRMQQRRHLLTAVPSQSLLYPDPLSIASSYDGLGRLPLGLPAASLGVLGIHKGVLPGLESAGVLGLGGSALGSLGAVEDAGLLGASSLGLGMPRKLAELPTVPALEDMKRSDGRQDLQDVAMPENITS